MKLSFALPKSKPAESSSSLKAAPSFNSLEDDSIDAAPTASSSSSVAANKQYAVQSSTVLSRATRRKLEEQKKLDETVFEYDEVYEVMKEAEQRAKEKREIDTQERKPKYIGNLLASAATRKLDYIRAEEKMIQHEREREGDEFADKEQFVTQAYKDQMAEVRRAEEEEKRRAELEKATKKPSFGMARFYQQLLERSDEQHAATVAATSKSSEALPIGPNGPNLTITKPRNAPKSDLELAKLARAEGKEVELNDDNQIVDKRELLSAGLNLVAPNTRNLGGLRTHRPTGKPAEEDVQVHRAVGHASSRREINERRARELERQIEEEQRRLQKQKEKEEQEDRERIIARKNNEDEIQNARARYLERKRRKLEDGAALAVGVADGQPVT